MLKANAELLEKVKLVFGPELVVGAYTDAENFGGPLYKSEKPDIDYGYDDDFTVEFVGGRLVTFATSEMAWIGQPTTSEGEVSE